MALLLAARSTRRVTGDTEAAESCRAATLPGANGLGYCPACKTGHVLRGKTAFGCARFREGCNFPLAAEIYGEKLSDPQVKALLAKGRTPVMKGFVGAAGQNTTPP